MKSIIERIGASGIVAVAVIEDANDAVPTSKALLAGGVDVIEITFRTSAAAEAISRVAAECPEILVGAGTVINLEQCKAAVAAGAKFIVSPGYNEEIVDWCIENNVVVTPGCITPTEIMAAISKGLEILKFFPAADFGGLTTIKALSGPFGNIKFIPTGGINLNNITEYLSSPVIHAVGGSWICSKKDIKEKQFEKITALCREARNKALGYEVVHIGINTPDSEEAFDVSSLFAEAFNFQYRPGASSDFVSDGIEVMKSMYLGKNGHIAVRTNNIFRAMADLENRGFKINRNSAKYKGEKLIAIYLEKEFGGFAIHLMQK